MPENKLNRMESKLLLYFKMVAEGCREYATVCEYSPYFCGYSKPREEPVNTYELCLFATGVIKCPGEIEKHYREKHNKSSYRTILRTILNLEKKGHIERSESTDLSYYPTSKWYMTYRLARHRV